MELAQSNSGTLCVEQFLVDPLMVATGCSWRRILQRSGKPVMVPTNAGGTGYPTLDIADDMAQLMAASPQLMVAVKLQVDAFKRALADTLPIHFSAVRELTNEALIYAKSGIVLPCTKPLITETQRCRFTKAIVVSNGDKKTIGRHFAVEGEPLVSACNHRVDNHPDVQADAHFLNLFSAAPELYEAALWLKSALETWSNEKPVKNADEIILFAEQALDKADYEIFNTYAKRAE